eukprot:6963462-Pyramimonas_sp.AAC.1
MTQKGGLGGIRTARAGLKAGLALSKQSHTSCSSTSQNSIPGRHFQCPEPTVGHFVLFDFPELHYRATFWMLGAN